MLGIELSSCPAERHMYPQHPLKILSFPYTSPVCLLTHAECKHKPCFILKASSFSSYKMYGRLCHRLDKSIVQQWNSAHFKLLQQPKVNFQNMFYILTPLLGITTPERSTFLWILYSDEFLNYFNSFQINKSILQQSSFMYCAIAMETNLLHPKICTQQNLKYFSWFTTFSPCVVFFFFNISNGCAQIYC